MCLFCCDMLCWFSVITCCGCRDMVTRKLVFFPPEPYYDQCSENEEFNEFYTRLQEDNAAHSQNNSNAAHQQQSSDHSNDVVLEVGANSKAKRKSRKADHKSSIDSQPSTTNEIEALNPSEGLHIATTTMTTTTTIKMQHSEADNSSNRQRKRKKKRSNNTDPSPSTFGTFRIRDDKSNLAEFYRSTYSLDIHNFHSQFLITERGVRIASYYIKNPTAEYTILFSHGNAADIGLMRHHLCRMYQKCNVSIFAYEYSGYGRSDGKPSEKNTYADIERAYEYCINQLRIPPARLIAYGQSLGTCVSVYLASKKPVGGVILHSPLMSGLRVMQHFDKTYWFDIYPVVEQIQQVFAPVFVIHGNQDKEIDVIHGKILSRIAPNAYQPWFVPYAGHNDIEVLFPEPLFKKISKFLKYIKNLEDTYKETHFVHDHEQKLDNEEEEEMDVTEDAEDIADEEDEEVDDEDDDDDTTARFKRAANRGLVAKSMTRKNADVSISPPPPQSMADSRMPIDSITTKHRQTTLPSRKFSNTANSLIDDEESVPKTPSVGASMSMKDSVLISMSIKDEKSTNKNYETVLTPTMRTIHSKEQSTSEMLTLEKTAHNIDDSQTMSTVGIRYKPAKQQQRKTRKNIISSRPGIDELDVEEEKGGDMMRRHKMSHSSKYQSIHTNAMQRMKKRKRKRKAKNIKLLTLPTSTNMMKNVEQCFQRLDKLPLDEYDDSSCSSLEDDDEERDEDDMEEHEMEHERRNNDTVEEEEDVDDEQEKNKRKKTENDGDGDSSSDLDSERGDEVANANGNRKEQRVSK